MKTILEILKTLGSFLRSIRLLGLKKAKDDFEDKADEAVHNAVENNDTTSLEDLSR